MLQTTVNHLQQNEKVDLNEPQNVQCDVRDIKVEPDLEYSECTSINTSSIMRDEFIVGDSDIPSVIIKKENIIEEPETIPSDLCVVIKEEPVTEESEYSAADIHSGMPVKVFLNEPDHEHFLDEVI